MKTKLNIFILCVLLLSVINTKAQNLATQIISTSGGGKALVVSITEGALMTALQFNLALPEGVTLAESDITLGTATDGHTLCVEPLENGDMLFVLYSLDLNTFMDGELLRIPITADNIETVSNGNLYMVRTATTEAESHTCEDVTVSMEVTDLDLLGDVNNDGTVDISDYIGVANHILGNTPEGFNETAADVNNDGAIDISDYIGVANIILTGKP